MSAVGYVGGDPRKVDVDGYVKGDVLAADASGVLGAVSVGVDGTVLTANASTPDGVDWEFSSGGGVPSNNPTFTGTATFNGRQVTTPDVLTFAATIATDASLGNHFRVTLTGNATLGAPTNPTDGQRVIWEIIQNGAGSNTLAYNAIFKFGPIFTNTIASTANAVTYLGAVYNASRNSWDVLAFGAGY